MMPALGATTANGGGYPSPSSGLPQSRVVTVTVHEVVLSDDVGSKDQVESMTPYCVVKSRRKLVGPLERGSGAPVNQNMETKSKEWRALTKMTPYYCPQLG